MLLLFLPSQQFCRLSKQYGLTDQHFLFTVLPKMFLTVRHVLNTTALCREQGEDRAVSSCRVICLE